MILVDTSVWVDYFRGVDSPEADRLDEAISRNEEPYTCGPVLTEVLQGIQSEPEYAKVSRAMARLPYLPLERPAYFLAAHIYRKARAEGHTIRNTVDCIIAACAITNDVPLLQRDRDFRTLAAVSKLRLVEP